MIIMVMGLPGSGKSYFAERLAKSTNAEYISSDRLRKELLSTKSYSDEEKAKVYNVMLQKMEKVVNREKDVVLDATFHKNKTRELFLKKAKGTVFFIKIWAEGPVIDERLKKSRAYSDADHGVYELIQKQWEPLSQPHLSLKSTNENIDSMLQKAMEYMTDDPKPDR